MTAVQYPSTVEVPTVQPTQLPNLPGNGGVTVTNDDPTYSVDVSIYAAFPANQTQTLQAHQSTMFPAGSPVWARVTPGQSGSPSSVNVSVYPGSPSPPQGSVIVPNQVTVNGTVDVGTISGTIDANITNANLPVSGSVDANITNASLTVGGTVSLTAGQVVEVTNASGGSLTVAGTVDAAVTGNVTIDAGTVNIQPVESEHLATTTSGVFPTVTPSPNAIGLAIISDCSLVTVTGVQTGARYPVQIANPDVINQAPLLWYSPICIGEDTSYNVTTNLSNGDSYLDEVFSGITAVINPVIDGGDLSILLTTFSNTANTGFGSPPGSTVVKILSTSGGPNIFPRVSDVSDNPPTPPGPIAPYYPVRLLTTLIDGSTWWEVDVIPNHSYWVTFVDGFFNQVACSGKIYSSSKSTGWPTCPTSWTVVVPNPAAGATWSYTLPGPAKLVAASGEFAAYNYTTAYTRYPAINFGGLGIDLQLFSDSSAITNGQTLYWGATKGTPKGFASASYAANVTMAELPDIVLPGGFTISGSVPGMQPDDQWTGIVLTFAAV